MIENGLEPNTGEDESSVDLRHYYKLVMKRKWMVMATMALGVTLAVLYTMRQTPLYQASASVIIDPTAPQVYGKEVQEVVQLGSGNYWSTQEYYNTQLKILRSRTLAQKTIIRNELHNDPRVVRTDPGRPLPEAERIEFAVNVLLSSVTASLEKDSRIAYVRVINADPALAAELANLHATTFRTNNVEQQKGDTSDAADFLARELDLAEKDLREAEKKLVDFKEENSMLSIGLQDKQNILSADLARYNAALSDAHIARIELEGLNRQAKVALKQREILESAIFGLVENSSASLLKEQYIRENQVFIELGSSLGTKHPDFLAQKKKVADLYGAIEREGRLALKEIDQRLKAVTSNERRFEAELERLKADAFGLAPKTVAYGQLQRAHDATKEKHRIVLGRLRASTLSLRNDVSNNVREHDMARVPTSPISPRMSLNVAVAAFMSLLLGLSLAFGLEHLDRTVKTGADVEAAVRVPLLGLIPIVQDLPKTPEALRERDLFVYAQPKSRAAECCRSIRTNLLFSGADRDLTVLTVSSPNPQEGKTTSVIYMGTTMAQSGQKVLLVDTDMRRPRLHASMGVSRGKGISNLILGDAEYDDCIKSTEIPNLFVLPCGPTPPNPAELLLTDRFKAIIEELRGKYDRVIFDSPPLQAVTDAVVLGKLCDGAIMVTQAGKTNREDLARCAKMWKDVDANFVGVVLNDLDLADSKYGYSYYAYSYAENASEAESQA
ncbi:MAG: polysaccharide biosynthesis tyrosine autokinase [Myxococcales bacterium]|nr:polysaccharide biosynthesis tyrosine autokinase [Myxococcales bacterium]